MQGRSLSSLARIKISKIRTQLRARVSRPKSKSRRAEVLYGVRQSTQLGERFRNAKENSAVREIYMLSDYRLNDLHGSEFGMKQRPNVAARAATLGSGRNR
jgi:hypothetical protein